MEPITIFPEPQELLQEEGVVVLSSATGAIRLCERYPSPLAEAAHARLRRRVDELGGRLSMGADICGSIELVMRRPKVDPDHDQKMDFAPVNKDQSYIIQVSDEGVFVTASDGPGLLYGVVTLCKLMQRDGDNIIVPKVTIRDWPDMKYRGLFAESRWGMDLMTLDDWKAAVDYLVDMKYNVLTVGVYNCWPAQYEGDVSEWLMLPLSSFPKLRKQQFIDYYSAKDGEWKHLKYLPKMFSEDFFGQLVQYGTGRGMIVRPHFNSPGHNSLIPRLMPEISARDKDGNPTGYGFCLSCDETYEVMFKIIDEVVDRYLLPNGCSSYHIAADEVYPLVGMHPDKLYERLSPWCQCDRCRQRSEGENYVQYIERIVAHLHEKGINLIGMWYDQLVRGGSLNQDLASHFEKIGAKDDIVLHWWDYGDFFETTHPELGFRRWVTPMTGYYYQTAYRGHLENIYMAERLGHEEGCEGSESYGVFDPAFHRHFAAQAEWSWNYAGGGTQQAFKLKYASYLFGEHWEEGLVGLSAFQEVVDSAPSANLAYSLFRYGYDYGQSEEQATARDNYPQSQISQLTQTNPALGVYQLRTLAARADRATSFFERDIWKDTTLQNIYLIECRRISAMARAHAVAAGIVKSYACLATRPLDADQKQQALQQLAEAGGSLQALITEMDTLFVAIEDYREPYLQPHMLRELSMMRRFLVALADELKNNADALTAGSVEALPELAVMTIKPVPWVG